jgi:hypothetical protein
MPEKHKMIHFIRLGTHAEQKYFIQHPDLYDVLVLNSNIVEYFAKGTASLLAGPLMGRDYFIDPITHSFGQNPRYLMAYDDNQKPKGIKKSIKLVAERYGSPVIEAINQPRALLPTDLVDIGLMRDFTQRVLIFQKSRLSEALEEDIKYLDADESLNEPIFLVAPYFYLDISNYQDWLPVNLLLIKLAKEAEPDAQILGEIVIDRGILDDETMWQSIANAYISLEQYAGLVVWISDFSEHEVSKPQLVNMRLFIEYLAQSQRPIYNLYGGYYSILLYHYGLSGVCHGPGYGEDRHVVPIGGGIPKPKYYLTPVHQRLLHADVQFLIDQGAWSTTTQFHNEVCNCTYCRKVLDGDLGNFYRFGIVEPRIGKNGNFYNVPLPETVELMNFHYLEAKAIEFNNVISLEPTQLIQQLEDAYNKYLNFIPAEQLRYLISWASALKR